MTSSPFSYFKWPLDTELLLRKKNAIKVELLSQQGLLAKRIAVLGGSTTAEVVDQLEIFLLGHGIRPIFYQSEYNKYYEDGLFPSDALKNFKPDLVFIHTSFVNIESFPLMTDTVENVDQLLMCQLSRFQTIWDGIAKNLQCAIVQNNFEQPWHRPLGNLDGSDHRGRSRFVMRLNEMFAEAAMQRSDLHIHDIHYLSARLGMDRWFNPRLWYLYKYAMDLEMIPYLAHSLSALIASLWGLSRKALVLDLDNTLWGGVIGDEGLEGIQLGAETAEAEAYTDFQRYVIALKDRGVILAAASKNDEANARLGFTHPDSLLSASDFSAFKANWDPKPQNLEAITTNIGISLQSLVFVDDNPAEREIIRAQLPMVSVPEMGGDITEFIRVLDRAALFETVSLSKEDLQRSEHYLKDTQRRSQQAQFASYDDFLVSLEMKAEICAFSALYMERITQLINKTNQFNLTTRRYTQTDVEKMATDNNYITFYGRLQDKFGDNGLVSVVVGEIKGSELHLDLWLMSCRVLKRGMECAMFDQLYQAAKARQIKKIIGYYLPTAKNNMVKNLYGELGFVKIKTSAEQDIWSFDLSANTPVVKYFIQTKN